jgi:hypothetical protein
MAQSLDILCQFQLISILATIHGCLSQVRVACGVSGDQSVEPLGHVPLVKIEDIQHDDNAISYCNGPFMVMEG